MGELDYAPPVDEIPKSQFGGYAKDLQPVKVTSTQVQEDGRNAWVRAAITGGPYADQGEFSMNLYLPTKEELNRKMKEKGDKEKALACFFGYKETCGVMGIPAGKTIAEALALMVGWEGDALFEKREGFDANIKKFLRKGFTTTPETPAAATGEEASDTPF